MTGHGPSLISDAPTVLAQLPAAFEHFNEVHPENEVAA
jgi:hypothetical protein